MMARQRMSVPGETINLNVLIRLAFSSFVSKVIILDAAQRNGHAGEDNS
jgi:hypothetical protein